VKAWCIKYIDTMGIIEIDGDVSPSDRRLFWSGKGYATSMWINKEVFFDRDKAVQAGLVRLERFIKSAEARLHKLKQTRLQLQSAPAFAGHNPGNSAG